MAAFLVGWALLGALASVLPWRASFSSDGRERVVIPASDPRAALHAKSAALAAHLERARTPPAAPLDPNTATREELDRLPGVGPKTALRWIGVRGSGGPFFALQDLRRVSGLGPKRLEGIAPHLRFLPDRAEGRRGRSPERLDLNGASHGELTALPRVGPVLAGRIVAYRASHGPFRSLVDLDSVPGVGPAMLKRLEGRVRFE
jgi:competence ComEA-like helix-hairpin-helix protein